MDVFHSTYLAICVLVTGWGQSPCDQRVGFSVSRIKGVGVVQWERWCNQWCSVHWVTGIPVAAQCIVAMIFWNLTQANCRKRIRNQNLRLRVAQNKDWEIIVHFLCYCDSCPAPHPGYRFPPELPDDTGSVLAPIASLRQTNLVLHYTQLYSKGQSRPLVLIKNVLTEFPEVKDVTRATATSKHQVQCHIEKEGTPVRTSPRRLMPGKLQTAQKHFDLMCAAGICRWSKSSWSCCLHLVPNKDGSWRLCGDHHHVNDRTIHDCYPLPYLHDFTAKLSSAVIFSKVGLVKGFYQIPVRPQDIPKTAIATPYGLFEFVRMPFGLKNAAQTFQRFIDVVTPSFQWR